MQGIIGNFLVFNIYKQCFDIDYNMCDYACCPKMEENQIFWFNQTHKKTPVTNYGIILTLNTVGKGPYQTYLVYK